MKCVKQSVDGKIIRIPDEEADVMVREQKAVFVPKKEWRAQRDAGKEQVKE